MTTTSSTGRRSPLFFLLPLRCVFGKKKDVVVVVVVVIIKRATFSRRRRAPSNGRRRCDDDDDDDDDDNGTLMSLSLSLSMKSSFFFLPNIFPQRYYLGFGHKKTKTLNRKMEFFFVLGKLLRLLLVIKTREIFFFKRFTNRRPTHNRTIEGSFFILSQQVWGRM